MTVPKNVTKRHPLSDRLRSTSKTLRGTQYRPVRSAFAEAARALDHCAAQIDVLKAQLLEAEVQIRVLRDVNRLVVAAGRQRRPIKDPAKRRIALP